MLTQAHSNDSDLHLVGFGNSSIRNFVIEGAHIELQRVENGVPKMTIFGRILAGFKEKLGIKENVDLNHVIEINANSSKSAIGCFGDTLQCALRDRFNLVPVDDVTGRDHRIVVELIYHHVSNSGKRERYLVTNIYGSNEFLLGTFQELCNVVEIPQATLLQIAPTME